MIQLFGAHVLDFLWLTSTPSECVKCSAFRECKQEAIRACSKKNGPLATKTQISEFWRKHKRSWKCALTRKITISD